MPVEIREVVIKATLHQRPPQKEKKVKLDSFLFRQLQEDILAICMEKLDEKIRKSQER